MGRVSMIDDLVLSSFISRTIGDWSSHEKQLLDSLRYDISNLAACYNLPLSSRYFTGRSHKSVSYDVSSSIM